MSHKSFDELISMGLSDTTIKILIFIFAVVSVFLAAGPALFGTYGTEAWMGSWQRLLFSKICHQLPHRSFLIAETPMAVCSRCFGFYWGLAAGLPATLLIPARFHIRKVALIVLISAIGIITADVIINLAGLWQNTLTSRFITGLFLGSALFSAIFFKQTNQPVYGTDST